MALSLLGTLLLAAIAFLAPLAVLLLLRVRTPQERTVHLMLGASAGLLLGISLLELLPESFEIAAGATPPLDARVVSLSVAAGFLGLLIVERYLLHRAGALSAHYEEGREIRPFGTLAMGALVIHGLIDGIVIPLGFAVSSATGLLVATAVVLHQIPDAFAAFAFAASQGEDRRRVVRYVILGALDTPVGMVLGLFLVNYFTPSWVALALAFSAGTFLFVSAADIIPELQHKAQSLTVTISIGAGLLLVALLAFFLPGV